MKKWNQPVIEVLGVDETKYGSETVTSSDGVYVDKETGNKYYGWAISGQTEENAQNGQ